jgi:hypothetical protein
VTQPTERMVQGGGSTDGDDGNCSGSRCGIISSFPDPAPRQWAKEGDEGVLAPPNRVDHEREISPAALASVEWIDSVAQFLVGRRKESGTTLHEGECEWGEWAGGWLLQDARGMVCGRVE